MAVLYELWRSPVFLRDPFLLAEPAVRVPRWHQHAAADGLCFLLGVGGADRLLEGITCFRGVSSNSRSVTGTCSDKMRAYESRMYQSLVGELLRLLLQERQLPALKNCTGSSQYNHWKSSDDDGWEVVNFPNRDTDTNKNLTGVLILLHPIQSKKIYSFAFRYSLIRFLKNSLYWTIILLLL